MAWNTTDISWSKLIFFEGSKFEECGLEELLYSTAEVLGKGTFGTTYKAELPGKNTVVVKRLKGGCLSEIEFSEKVKELGRMSHENLLPLRAYCCHQNERLLLYDYKHIASLASALHGGANKTPLSWEVRSRIAYGIARGITYLHSQGSNVCHGNIRSSNVFVSNYDDVQLSEYCMAQLVSLDSKLALVDGYCPPEVTNMNEVSQKSDVYSFGVLLLELLTGKAPLNVLVKDKGTDLPKWVRTMFQEKPIIEVFDNALQKYQDSRVGEQMVELLQLAVCCTFQYHNKRPSIGAVTNRIRETCNFKP
ncbi:hypothetical protein Pfo_023616 [Paulownia fortunei]|nr:hypothetical protein Pfo_023616 [Paulownia fortunei]